MLRFLDFSSVKWEGYQKPTWEPIQNMPSFIKKFVDEKGCGRIPDPIVRHEKIIDGNKHVMLEWTTDAGERDVLCQALEKKYYCRRELNCDTKKNKVIKFKIRKWAFILP